MNITSYINKLSELNLIDSQNIKEVILAPKELSRKGKLDSKQVFEIIKEARNKNIRCVLEWDVLINEIEIDKQIEFFNAYLECDLDAIRVQDPGALEFILQQTHFQVQWITEHGNHNCLGLEAWSSYIGERLDRLIISNELSYEKIKYYQASLNIDIEVLVLGKILLFYTPRLLLSPVFVDHDDDSRQEVHAIADSEESPHKGFHVVENRHGTFMYHLKDLCLLNESERLKSLGERFWGRIELVFHQNIEQLPRAISLLNQYDEASWASFKTGYPVGLTKGFFLTNKTNVLFPKLKNYRRLRADLSYIGEVIDVVKDEYLVFLQKSKSNFLTIGQKLQSTSPEGKVTQFEVQVIQDLHGRDVSKVEAGCHYMLKYRKGIVPKTVFNTVTDNASI